VGGGSLPEDVRARKRARRALGLAVLGLAVLLLALPKPWSLASGPGFASPDGRPLFDTVAAAAWWVSALNALLCLGLLATVPLWVRPLGRPEGSPLPRPDRRTWIWLALAALLALGLRLPLASGSLWWDEGWAVRRVVVGVAAPDPADPSRVVVERPPWSRPFWDYRKPTNHVVNSVLGRLSVDAWRAVSGAEPWEFDELAFRLPSLVAAVATVVLLGVLLVRFGLPRVGVASAFLLAIHPWHIRYGVEARAYSLVLLLSVLGALALTDALRSGRWRHFLAYGGSQLLLLWVQPAGIYLTLGLGSAGALGLLTAPYAGRVRVAGLVRLAVVNLLAAMAFLQVMAPNVAQSLTWDDVHQPETQIEAHTVLDLWSRLTTGIPLYRVPEADPPEAYPALEDLAGGVGSAVVIFVFPVLALLGLARLLARPEARWAIVGLLAGVVLALLITWARHFYYYHRFVIYGLALVVPALCAGVDGIALALARGRHRGRVAAGALVVGLVAYQVMVAPRTAVLLTRPLAPMRDVALWLRARAGDDPASVRRVGIGLGGEMLRIYDPWLHHVETEAGLREEMAAAGDRPLFVVYGYEGTNRPRHPGIFRRLDDPTAFAEAARFLGTEPHLRYQILRRLEPGREGAAP
jgi:hypothetical protein